jgi:hypothetical protein
MKEKTKKLLDYFPLAVLMGYAIQQWSKFYENEIVMQWQTCTGIALLLLAIIGFIKKHQAGVLLIGLTCVCGLAGIASLSPAIVTGYFGNNLVKIPVGNPIFFLFLALHLFCSFRFYVGILTKQYWKDLTKKS